MELEGQVWTWSAFGGQRQYGIIGMKFEQARKWIVPVRFDALTGRGQQREIVRSHCNKLVKEIRAMNYTPTPVSACLPEGVEPKISDEKFSVTFDKPLNNIDGGHRFTSLETILRQIDESIEKAKDEESKAELTKDRSEILNLPINVVLYLDGDPQTDFVNLQAGKSVDAAHLGALKNLKGQTPVTNQLAFDAAAILHETIDSPYFHQIRFDSRGVLPLPFTSLCSRGSSDLATSLVGLGKFEKDPEWIAERVTEAYRIIQDQIPEALEYGKYLTPVSNGGSKGSSSMLLAVAVCLGYELSEIQDVERADKETWDRVADAAAIFDEKVAGNFAGPLKRSLAGRFARAFFEESDVEKHEGIPIGLIQLFSASAFGVSPLPKVAPARRSSRQDPVIPQDCPAAWEEQEVMG